MIKSEDHQGSTQCKSLVQVLRYTLYGKERSTFVDASFLRNDWWQRVRDLFNPPKAGEDGEDEEDCTEGAVPWPGMLATCLPAPVYILLPCVLSLQLI